VQALGELFRRSRLNRPESVRRLWKIVARAMVATPENEKFTPRERLPRAGDRESSELVTRKNRTMIAIRKTPPAAEVRIPPEARAAIARGIRRGDAVANLEYLGLSPRYMNLLENSRFNIITLQQLMAHNRDELLDIPGFGESALQQLFECLARYDELELAMLRHESRERPLSDAERALLFNDE